MALQRTDREPARRRQLASPVFMPDRSERYVGPNPATADRDDVSPRGRRGFPRDG